MAILLHLLPAIPAVVMMVEDFRRRSVRLVWLIAFAMGTAFISVIRQPAAEVLSNILHNVLLILYFGCGIFLWLRLWYRKKLADMKEYLGTGDIIFMLALTPLFPLREYLLFLLTAMIFSLVWWLCAGIIRRKSVTVPFVGTSGIILCGHFIFQML